MLAILYIISTISCILTVIFDEQEEYKDSRTYFCIAIGSEIIYAIIAINHFRNNIFDLSFGIVFGFLSLLFGNYTIFLENGKNWSNYIICAFLGSVVLCFLFSDYYTTNYYIYCNENHDYSKRIPIVTTLDGSQNGESIYGDGFTIGLIVKQNPNIRIYQYYYQREDGKIVSDKFYENRVKFNFISPDESPYVEIYYNVDCIGYRKNSKKHTFGSVNRTCHFYIPENSIANLPPNS